MAKTLRPNDSLGPAIGEMHYDEIFPDDADECRRLAGGEYFHLTGARQCFVPVEDVSKYRPAVTKNFGGGQDRVIAPDPFLTAKGRKIVLRKGGLHGKASMM